MKAAIVYDSRTHTTEKAAAFMAEGIKAAGDIEVQCFNIDEADFEFIAQTDMIIFGSPTYVASVTGKMKVWLDKIIAELIQAYGKINPSKPHEIRASRDFCVVEQRLIARERLMHGGR